MASIYDKYVSSPAAAGAETQTQPVTEEQPALSLGDRATDLARAGVGMLRDVAQGTVQAPLAIGEALSPVTDKAFGLNPEVTKAAFKEVRSKLSFSEVEQQQTVLGGVTRTLGKWIVLGFAMPGTAAAAGAGVAARIGAGAGADFVQGFIGTAPDEKNLGNLAVDHLPEPLQGPVRDFWATSPDDSEAEVRLKGAVENVAMGGLAKAAMIGFKAVRSARALAAAGKVDEAAKVMDEAAPLVQKAHAKAVAEPVQMSIFPDNAGVYTDTPTITVFRHGAPKGKTSFFGESEGMVSPFRDAGPLHSMEVSASDLEKYRVSNILKDPNAHPDVLAEAKKLTELDQIGMPENEFIFPKDLAKGAADHAERMAVMEATTQAVKKEDLLNRFTLRRSDEGGLGAAEFNLEGNVNYAKYNSIDSVKQLVSDVVHVAKKDLPDLMGSYQSQKETGDLARILGKDVTDLYTSLASMRMNASDMAAHIVAGKALINRVSADLWDVANRLSIGQGTDVDKVAFAHMTDVLASTMDHVAGLTTEAARATAAGRMRVGMQGITKENFAKLLEKVGGNESVMALAKRIAAADDAAGVIAATKGTPGKFMAIHNFIWMNGVLGGFKTSIVNLSTTGFNSGLMPGYRIIGGLADVAGAKLGIKGADAVKGMDQVYQGLYQYEALSAVWRDAIKMGAKAFKQGESILDVHSSPLGHLKGNLLAQDFTGIENEMIGRGVEEIGKFVGLPSKFLVAQDEFYKQLVYRSHIMASAKIDGLKQGLDGQALTDFVSSRLTASMGKMGEGLDDAAMLAAKNATFTQDLAAETLRGNRTISEGIHGFANAHPVVKGLILPFVKVPSNLIRQAWDMTPGLDLLRTQFRADIAAGGEARAVALGKMGVGTAMWGTAMTLGLSGRITGAGPRDKDLRRQLGPKWKPYSFVFNNDDGTKEYISFARFDPFGMFFGLSADMAEVGGKLKEAEYGEAAGKMSLALLKNLSSKTYLRALTDVLDAATGDEQQFKRWAQSRIASYVPGYVQLLNTDDELKDIRGWFDGLISRVPGWSDTLEAKRDNFGDKIMPPMGHPYTAFNPFTFFRSTKDPVRLELAGLAQDDIEAKFPLPSPTFGPKGNEVDLREIKNAKGQSAYDRWLELHAKMEVGGKTLHESMGELFQSDSYKEARAALGKGDPTYRTSLAVDMVRKEFDLYEKQTWAQIEEEFPGLAEAVLEFKVGGKTSRIDGSGTAPGIQQLRGLAGQR